MSERSTISSHGSLRRVRRIAEFQFGRGAGEALFPETCTFQYSTSKRIRYISDGGRRLATVRAQDGRLTLSYDGAERIHAFSAPPMGRVILHPEAVPFVLAGKNAMAKHVIGADPDIRAEDEVFVVDEEDTLLATGMAVLSGSEMLEFKYGGAVKVRQGRDKR
nr:PUA domain-containing protein [Methanocalculus alkaliphilus]